jgi:hypothetical protein
LPEPKKSCGTILSFKITLSTLIIRLNQQLEKYQEQPSLLDPHMEGLVVPLMRRVRAHRDRSVAGSSEPEEDAFVLAIFRLLYTLCKVRGYKTVGTSLHCAALPHIFFCHRASLVLTSLVCSSTVRFFPHEIIDLEPTFSYIVSHSSVPSTSPPLFFALSTAHDLALAAQRRGDKLLGLSGCER